MKVYLWKVRVLALGCFVILANCQGKNADLQSTANQDPDISMQTPASSVASASTAKCDNGQAPKIISGDCSGLWSVKKTDDVANCEFAWKPTVTCPTGMKAIGLQSACYGVTIRPVESHIKSAEDCATAHGKYPISPAYKLECCP